MNPQKILLTVEYDGSGFVGWQRQPSFHGVSVQQTLEEVLGEVYGEHVATHGAGRTDAGVHALGQRCHFWANKPVPIEKLPQILNQKLPSAVRVREAEPVADSFHARISARGKHYRYVIERGAAASAFTGRYTWQLEQALDVAAMREGAAFLLGEHDFRHYTLSGASVRSFVRRLDRLSITEPAAGETLFPWCRASRPLLIDAEGNGFLYKMVRLIVGRLVSVGRGEIMPSRMGDYLDGSFTQKIPPAPPQGLMLMEVRYDGDK